MSTPHERLKAARLAAGFKSARDATDRFGWTYPTYAGHENGTRGITPEAAEEYGARFRVSPSYIVFGEREAQGEVLAPDAIIPEDLIPVYDVSASAGDGSIVEYESVACSLGFPSDYLRRTLRSNPRDLAILTVNGYSMMPTLKEDDLVMVDTSKRNIGYDGMFVVRHDDVLKVKRLRWGEGRRTIWLISDNEDNGYPPIEVPAENLAVIGRVMWTGGKV